MASMPARRGAAQGRVRLAEHYRRFWEEAFDCLEDYLRELQKSESKKKEHKNGRKK